MVKKKITPRKKKSTKKAANLTPRRILIGVGLGLLAIVSVMLLLTMVGHYIQRKEVIDRANRIEAIYESIDYNKPTYHKMSNIFGDKRPYDYDKSRTQSSVVSFYVGEDVDVVAKDLDKAIQAAGFTRLEDPYPGSVIVQHHYKSDNGEYVRLTVSSKVRDDKGQQDIWMNGEFSNAFFKIDPNQGPADVTIKVNLDDNNE